MQTKSRFWHLSIRQIGIAAAFGGGALACELLGLKIPWAPGVVFDVKELWVLLGSAMGGPMVGAIIGFLSALLFAPERNIPMHVVGGVVTGIFYAYLWKKTYKSNGITEDEKHRNKLKRIAIWIAYVCLIYYPLAIVGICAPLYAYMMMIPFNFEFYLMFLTGSIPEIIMTSVVTTLVWLALPETIAAPQR